MTNFNKYQQELTDMVKNGCLPALIDGSPVPCHPILLCNRCDFSDNSTCQFQLMDWLLSESKETSDACVSINNDFELSADWISIDDSVPSKFDTYLAAVVPIDETDYRNYFYTGISYYPDAEEWELDDSPKSEYGDDIKVIAWKPLPDWYKGISDDVWTSIDTKPDDFGKYLVAWESKSPSQNHYPHYYGIADFDPDENIWCTDNLPMSDVRLLAWMPLPKLYVSKCSSVTDKPHNNEQWTSINDRLPDDNQKYLVNITPKYMTDKNSHFYALGRYHSDDNTWAIEDISEMNSDYSSACEMKVIAWMNLPAWRENMPNSTWSSAEKTPDHAGAYLIIQQTDVFKNTCYAYGIADFDKHNWYSDYLPAPNTKVLAWMPLPEPYE